LRKDCNAFVREVSDKEIDNDKYACYDTDTPQNVASSLCGATLCVSQYLIIELIIRIKCHDALHFSRLSIFLNKNHFFLSSLFLFFFKAKMDTLWILSVLLFIAVTGSMMFFLRSKEDVIRRWCFRRHHRLEREDYIRCHGDELMSALTKHQLTIYVDKELDEAHEEGERKYTAMNMAYLYHMEKSYETVRLEGHLMPFNDQFARLLIHQYCLPRWWLITQLCKRGSALVLPYLYQLMQPRIDRETRPDQRAQMKAREELQ